MIVYFNQPLTADQQAEIESGAERPAAGDRDIRRTATPSAPTPSPRSCSPATRRRSPACRPSRSPCSYKIVPTDDTDVDDLQEPPGVAQRPAQRPHSSRSTEGTLDVISKLKGFVGLYTVILSIALLFAAVLLIWNTIRTAMFARRREIEVMKLVGATDWFIRIPFMLEGLIQGCSAALGACAGLWVINNRWTAGVARLPGEQRLRLDGGRERLLGPGDGAVARASAWSSARSAPASPPAASSTSEVSSLVRSTAAGARRFPQAAIVQTLHDFAPQNRASALADQGEAVAHGEDVRLDAVVGGDLVVERLDARGVGAVLAPASTTRPDHSVLSASSSPPGRTRGTSSSK